MRAAVKRALKRVFTKTVYDLGKSHEPDTKLDMWVVFCMAALMTMAVVMFKMSGSTQVVVEPFPSYSLMKSMGLPKAAVEPTPLYVTQRGWLLNGLSTFLGAVSVVNTSDALFHMTMASMKFGYPCVAGAHFGFPLSALVLRLHPQVGTLSQLGWATSAPPRNVTCVSDFCPQFLYTPQDASNVVHTHIPASEAFVHDETNQFLFMINPLCTPEGSEFVVSHESSHLCTGPDGAKVVIERHRTKRVKCVGNVISPSAPTKASEERAVVEIVGNSASCVHHIIDITNPSTTEHGPMEGVCAPDQPQ